MKIEADIFILPYCSSEGDSFLGRLIDEFKSGRWSAFRGAISFAKRSGNYPDLLNAMVEFAENELNTISITFGADVFGRMARGSDFLAVSELVDTFDGYSNANVHLYHERGRTFHPKLYLFSNVGQESALLMIGSSNWSEGGLINNVEANVSLRFDLREGDHMAQFEQLVSHFDDFWTEADD